MAQIPLVLFLGVHFAIFHATICSEILKLDDDGTIFIQTDNYPEPYSQGLSIMVVAEEDYYIAVQLNDLDLDGEKGHILLLKSGGQVNDGKEGRTFTHELKQPRRYLIHSPVLLIDFPLIGGNNPNKHRGFILSVQRMGSEATTIPTSTTEKAWPTPEGKEQIYLEVYIKGRKPEQFASEITLNEFKSAVVLMAKEHCQINNIMLSEPITNENILIPLVTECPISWPAREDCVHIRFAVPVYLDETSTDYQLNEANLQQMWGRLAEKYLAPYKMHLYTLPDNNSAIVMWLLISCLVVVIFVGCLYFVQVLAKRLAPIIKKQMSKQRDTWSSNTGLPSLYMEISGPHPKQTIPPFLEADHVSVYEPNPDVDEDDMIDFSPHQPSLDESET